MGSGWRNCPLSPCPLLKSEAHRWTDPRTPLFQRGCWHLWSQRPVQRDLPGPQCANHRASGNEGCLPSERVKSGAEEPSVDFGKCWISQDLNHRQAILSPLRGLSAGRPKAGSREQGAWGGLEGLSLQHLTSLPWSHIQEMTVPKTHSVGVFAL